MPSSGELVEAPRWTESAAGGACAAAVQLAKLAGHCDLYTAVGDDEVGERALGEMERRGVTVYAAHRPGPTRRALILTDSIGERTIVVHGARHHPRLEDPLPWSVLRSADCVLFTAGDRETLSAARAAAVLVLVARSASRPLAVEVDAVVGSADDAEEASVLDLLNRVDLVVATQGSRGGTFRSREGPTRSFPAPPLPGPIVDRYGAGDAFAAGLTFALGRGNSPEDAVELAARCGTAVLTGRGAYASQLTAEGLDETRVET